MTQAEAFHKACQILLESKVKTNFWHMIMFSDAQRPNGSQVWLSVDGGVGREWEFSDKSIIWVEAQGRKTSLPKYYM